MDGGPQSGWIGRKAAVAGFYHHETNDDWIDRIANCVEAATFRLPSPPNRLATPALPKADEMTSTDELHREKYQLEGNVKYRHFSFTHGDGGVPRRVALHKVRPWRRFGNATSGLQARRPVGSPLRGDSPCCGTRSGSRVVSSLHRRSVISLAISDFGGRFFDRTARN